MLPRKILILRSSEVARNVHFPITFCIFKVFKEGSQITRKGALGRSLEKKGARAPCALRFLRPCRYHKLRDAGKKVGQGGPTGAKGHLLP